MHVKGKMMDLKFKLLKVSLCTSIEALIQTAVENISKITRTGNADKH